MWRSWFPHPGAGPRLGGCRPLPSCLALVQEWQQGWFLLSHWSLSPEVPPTFPLSPSEMVNQGDPSWGYSEKGCLQPFISWAARQCFQVVTVTQKSCSQHLTFGACFGNENSSSYINTRVPHWDTVLRRGTGSHWCHDIKTVEDLPLLMVSKDAGSCSQRAGSWLTMQTRPVLFSWLWSWLRWRMPKRREDQSLVSVYVLAQWLVSPWR